MDHMRWETIDLQSLSCVVLDEADEMLRMGFIDDVDWIMERTPTGRQVALFSATVPEPIESDLFLTFLCQSDTADPRGSNRINSSGLVALVNTISRGQSSP